MQRRSFDGIQVRRVAGQELGLEMMPVEPTRLVPRGVVEHACLGRPGFGELVQNALEHVGVHAVDDEGEEFPLRGDGPDDVLADQVGHGAGPFLVAPSVVGGPYHLR